MDADAARVHFLGLPEAFEDYPFRLDIAVFKVVDKMFGTLAVRVGVAEINLKCDPMEAQALRDVFVAVKPGYHMNKTHWNTVILDGTVPATEIGRMIDASYGLVVKSMRKVEREALLVRHGREAVFRYQHDSH